MTLLLTQTISNINLSTSDYLRKFEKEITKETTLDALTHHFTADKRYTTEKPYLYRRKIMSNDIRFNGFQIVYDEFDNIHAVVFDLKIKLSELGTLFGQPLIQSEPYDETTAFAFKSLNPDIDIIKTRYPKWLTKSKIDRLEDLIFKDELSAVDINFEFVQFDIKYNCKTEN